MFCLVGTALAAALSGCTTPPRASPASASEAATPGYQPQRGQIGKDVMWLPTSAQLVKTMLTAAQVTPDDLVVDLGAGDGIIPITAAQAFGARAWGIEYNPKLAAYAQQQAERAGVAERARITQGDIFQEDFSAATVVTMYLLPELNLQLRPTLLAMKPGTRLVSHAFDMGDWEPDQTLGSERERAFLWIVPAPLAGQWVLRDQQGQTLGQFEIEQRFQRVGARMTLPPTPFAPHAATQLVLGARVEGRLLRFQYVGRDEGLHAVSLVQTAAGLQGEMTVHGATHPVSAYRVP
jgi:SAM-dependent methyltransferase